MRVEENWKRRQKSYCTLEKLAIAASTLLFFSLGYQFIKTDSKVITQAERKKTAWFKKKRA
jgi:hypothetical protein